MKISEILRQGAPESGNLLDNVGLVKDPRRPPKQEVLEQFPDLEFQKIQSDFDSLYASLRGLVHTASEKGSRHRVDGSKEMWKKIISILKTAETETKRSWLKYRSNRG